MIPDANHARIVALSAETFLRDLSAALEAARTSATPAEFARLKHAVGNVAGTLEVDLLWPLYKEYPTLEPENLKNWETGA